jgi:hypothetical protein
MAIPLVSTVVFVEGFGLEQGLARIWAGELGFILILGLFGTKQILEASGGAAWVKQYSLRRPCGRVISLL